MILVCNSSESFASSAPFPVFLLFQHWLGQRQRQRAWPGSRASEESHQIVPSMQGIETSLPTFKIPVYCAHCAVWQNRRSLSKTRVLPPHRNQSRLHSSLRPSVLLTYYGCTARIWISVVVRPSFSKGRVVLWAAEVKLCSGHESDGNAFFDWIFQQAQSILQILAVVLISGRSLSLKSL